MRVVPFLFFIVLFNSCRVGWELIDEDKGKNRNEISTLVYKDLPLEIKSCFNNGGNRHHAQLNICDSSNVTLNDFFVVSADYNGFPLRKMGVYIKLNNQKYFIDKPVASPLIVNGKKIYYTRAYGARFMEDSLKNNTIFYCFTIQ